MCLGLDLCVEEGEEQGVVDDEPSSQPPPRPFAAAFTFLIFFQLMGAVMLGFGIYALATDDQVAELIVDEDSSAYENLSSSCLLYTSPSPRDGLLSRMPSSA